MSDMSNAPISEQFRVAAKQWVELDAAASLLEETKSAVLSQKMAALGDIPVSHAERTVKSSADWSDHVSRMVKARENANLAKVKLEWLRMRFSEQQSFEATQRAEMKL
jgi:hypothetical protein